MQIEIPRNQLLPVLQTIVGVVEKRQTLPILANCLIEASDDQVRVTGTDREMEVSGFVSGITVPAPGRTTVSSYTLLEIIRTMPESSVIRLQQDDGRLLVSSGRSRFTLATLPAEDFPGGESVQEETSFSVDAESLEKLFHTTAFAMAHQDVRYYLNGLLLEIRQGQLRAVATDGHRMAMLDVEADISSDDQRQVIVPRKAVQELSRILRDVEGPVRVVIDQRHIRVEAEGFRVTSALIEGRFPDYEAVVPKQHQTCAKVDRELLRQALTQAAKLVNEKFRGVRLEFVDGTLRVTANNPDQEQADIELGVEYDAAPLEIGFNVQYLLDVLGVIGAEQALLWVADQNSSVRIEDPSSECACFVIMPMML